MAQNTKEVVSFILALGEAVGLSMIDGNIGLSDALYFFDAIRKIGPAIENIDQVTAEINAWTDADTAEILDLADQFDIPEENVKEIVKDAIAIAGPLVKLIAKFSHGS